MDSVTTTLLLLWLASFLVTTWNRRPYSSFQRVDKPWQWVLFLSKPVQDLTGDGYRKIMKISDQPFTLRMWSNDYLVLPKKYLTDLKGAGKSHLSFVKSISEAFYLQASVGDLYESVSADRMVQAIREGLNPRMPQASQIMVREIDYALQAETGNCSEWKEFNALNLMTGLVIRTASRIAMGEKLSRDDKFINTALGFFQSVFINAVVILYLPLGPFRNFFSWPISFFHRRKLAQIGALIEPVLKQRALERKSGKDTTEYMDAIEWTLRILEKQGESALDQLTRVSLELLQNLWASSSSPGSIITEMIFQTLLEPEYLEPLRKEAEASIAAHGWSEKAILHLPLQDSFIREINRLFPASAVSCLRTVMHEPFRFSDGLALPPGTRFGFPVAEIQHDAAHFSEPLRFDGFRFARLRAEESHRSEGEGASVWAAASVSPTNLVFGFGNHVCPGRFHGVRLLKIIFTRLITQYDVAWDRAPGSKRPARFSIEGNSVANTMQKIRIRKRVC